MHIAQGDILLIKTAIILGACMFTCQAANAVTELSYGLGLRNDKLDWNIASDPSGTATPNILSELKWNVDSIELALNLENFSESHIHFLLSGNYSFYSRGDNQDSDYFGDNRTLEFSRSSNNADDSSASGAKFALGYRIGPMPGEVRTAIGFIPLIGYGTNSMNTKMSDGMQVISTTGITPPVGPFPGLDSSYDATFKGTLAGAEFYVDRRNNWRFFINYYHHQIKYHGEGNWNLRADLAHPVSFVHEADGVGDVFNVGVKFNPSNDWSATLTFGYEKWHTDPGTDQVFASNGATGFTRFNEANWKVQRLLFMALYSF